MKKVLAATLLAVIALTILVPSVFSQPPAQVQVTNSPMLMKDQPKMDVDSNDNVHIAYMAQNCTGPYYQIFAGTMNYTVIEWDTLHINGYEWGTFQAVLYDSGTIDFNIMDSAGYEWQITGVNQGSVNGVSVSGTPTDNSSYRFTWDGISDYNASAIPYSWINLGTPTCVGALWDDSSGTVTFGFPFTFYGTPYNTVYVSSNGYMSFTNTYPWYYSPPPSFPSGSPTAANVIAPLWTDWDPDGEPISRTIWYTMLDSNGNTLIDETLISPGSWNKHPDVVVDSNDIVHVVWHDNWNYNGMAYSKIDPGQDNQDGSPANPGSIILVNDIPVAAGYSVSGHPRLAVDSNDNIHIVFGQDFNVYYMKTDNNGNVLIPPVTLATPPWWIRNVYPDLALDSYDNVHVVFTDTNGTLNEEVFYMMLDGITGNTLIAPTLLTPDDGAVSQRPRIVVDALDMAHIIWYDYRTMEMELFYTKIDPFIDDQNGSAANPGAITLIDDTLLTADDGIRSQIPQIDILCQNIHATWYNDQAVAAGMNPHYMMLDVYGNIVIPDTPLSAVGAATASTNRLDWMNAITVDSNNRAHMAWCDDRTGIYEIFYTNYSNNPSACPPFGESCDPGGTIQDLYMLGEDVYAMGSGFLPGALVDIYVKPDLFWNDLDPVPPGLVNTGTTVTTDGAGNIPPTLIWSGSLTVVGEYDIVFDCQPPVGGLPDGFYNEWNDWVDNRHDPGFVIQRPPGEQGGGGGPTVGGEVMLVNKAALVTQQIAMPVQLMMSFIL